ncbi:hypothetical protein, partial [Paenibacillus sp. MMO-58]|uniref:hypothetical protein n=1 Tax=Paenibacillus sp. MMO-58 TaxID=3081290 RepID=UPI0030159117
IKLSIKVFDLLITCFIAFPLFLTGQFRSLFSFQRTIFSTTLHILSRYRIQCQALFFIEFLNDVQLFVRTACLSRPELEYTIDQKHLASIILKNFTTSRITKQGCP